MSEVAANAIRAHVPWNKGKLIGAKPPLRPTHVWAIRSKLQLEGRRRDLAIFNLAIDSKLRACNGQEVLIVAIDMALQEGYEVTARRHGFASNGVRASFQLLACSVSCPSPRATERFPPLSEILSTGGVKTKLRMIP